MPKFIDAEALLGTLDLTKKASVAMGMIGSANCYSAVAKLIEGIPAADVAPVVRGEWQTYYRESEEDGEAIWLPDGKRCSQCGEDKPDQMISANYCSNCGRKMEGGEHHD